MIIECCYDSHVHWLGTGYNSRLLSCRHFRSKEDLLLIPQPIPDIDGWILGSGWNDNEWPDHEDPPNRLDLDKMSGDRPMVLWRADRHALWVNTVALCQSGLLEGTPGDWRPTPLSLSDPTGGKILRDIKGLPTGILVDLAMNSVLDKIPKPSSSSMRESLLRGISIFNQHGYTHIRDLSCNQTQWEAKLSLFEGEIPLTLAIEQYFSTDGPRDFDRALQEALRARSDLHGLKAPQAHKIRVCGVKIYLDGALGSEGAWVSEPYRSGSGNGLSLMTNEELQSIMRRTWEHSLTLAVHALGDEAVAQAARCGSALARLGIAGDLHLEHLEIARPETLRELSALHPTCHMQPCHWLSDHTWLEKKVPQSKPHYFPWSDIEKNGMRLFFGSDSPIEEPKLSDSITAITHAARYGIARPLQFPDAPWKYHQHPDPNWIPGCQTELDPITLTPVRVHFAHQEVSLTSA